jgi:hypothetical protein
VEYGGCSKPAGNPIERVPIESPGLKKGIWIGPTVPPLRLKEGPEREKSSNEKLWPE